MRAQFTGHGALRTNCWEKWVAGNREPYLGYGLANGGVEEISGVARVPAAEPVVELELHEVSRDGGDEHVAGAAANGVIELEDAVVPRPPLPRPHPARRPRQDLRDGLRHRRLLRHIQHADRAAAAAVMHREGRRRGGGEPEEEEEPFLGKIVTMPL